MKIPMD